MFFAFLARNILRYKPFVISAVAVVTIFMLYSATNLKLYYKPALLLPKYDSLLIKQNQFANLFGKGENLMVIGVQDSSFFKKKNLVQWIALSKKIREIEGVEHAFSITDIFNIVRNNETKTFIFNKVFDTIPCSQNKIDSLTNIAHSLPFYSNLLYNKEANVYLMAISLNNNVIYTKNRVTLNNQIVEACNEYSNQTGNSLKFSGLPYIRVTIAEMIKREMFLFIGLALFITVFILFYLFRSWRVVLFSQLVVAISVTWALGFMALMGYEITLLTAVIPPLIIVIGIPNCIFLLNKYHHEFNSHSNKTKSLYRSIQSIGSAIFLTNITTAAGFGTFIITNIAILKEFGLSASFGVMSVFVISILIIPSVFSYLNSPEPRHLEHLDNVRINRAITRVTLTTLYRRKTVFIVTLIVLVIGFIGFTRIRTKGYMVDDIPHNHPIYVDLKFFEKHFVGVMPVEIIIDSKKPKGILQEMELSRISRLQDELKEFKELSKPLSIVEAAKFTRQAYFNGNPSQYKLPRGPERGFIMSYLPKSLGKNELLSRFVDSTGQYTKIIYNVADIGTHNIKVLHKKIQGKIDSVYKTDSKYVFVGGGSILISEGNEWLVNSLFLSLLFAIGLISLFMAWMFRNPRMVLLSVLPNLVPLLITAAIMGFLGINLKPSTVIVFSIAFGISVDNSIHFLSRFRREFKRTKGNTKASVVCAISETGFSMIYTSLVLFFGFGIFMASGFGGTVSLGLLVSTTLLVALFCNLVLLPSILLSLARKSNTPECEDMYN